MNLTVGILAGGKSTRMGENKALLKYGKKSFIEHLAEELGGASQLLISAAEKGRYEFLGKPLVYDVHKNIGPIEGIYQILTHADQDYCFICAADMPKITARLVNYLAGYVCSDYDCFCVTTKEHEHPLCAIYSKAIIKELESRIAAGNYRLMSLLEGIRTKYIRLEDTVFDPEIVSNINTPEQYRRLQLPMVFCVSGVKNSGKTTMIVKLTERFVREGYKVAVIKHDGHDYIMDHENTDTWRFTQAGAMRSCIFTGEKYSVHSSLSVNAEYLIEENKDADVIILEGMKQSSLPKIELVRRGISEDIVCDRNTLICAATNLASLKSAECPVCELDDVDGIYVKIKAFFGI